MSRRSPETPSTSVKKARREASANGPPEKVVRCALHGQIKLHPLLVELMDTLPVQRLRRLRQLGCADHVYPSATHSRFEHSLGVAHLARELCRRLRAKHMPIGAEAPDEKDELCVMVAGLCHDLGHGPFSHTFETLFEKETNADGTKHSWFKHERMSIQLLDRCFKEVRWSSALPEDWNHEMDVKFIKELIDGAGPKDRCSRDRCKWYLYDIVANKACGLDVDRLDYLLRDKQLAINAGADLAIDVILESAAVRMAKCDNDDEPYPVIAFDRKAASELWKVFQLRFERFDKLYLHKNVMGREALLTDLVRAFDELPAPASDMLRGMRLRDAAQRPEDFVKLDDQMITRIQARIEDLEYQDSGSPELHRVTQLLYRYLRHSHYARLYEGFSPFENDDGVAALQELLDESRFKVKARVVHHGDGRANPMAKMHFFRPKLDDINQPAAPIPADEFDRWLPLPRHFQRQTVCVFFKEEGDAARKIAEQEVLEKVQEWRQLGRREASVGTSTPQRQRPSGSSPAVHRERDADADAAGNADDEPLSQGF